VEHVYHSSWLNKEFEMIKASKTSHVKYDTVEFWICCLCSDKFLNLLETAKQETRDSRVYKLLRSVI
jgi:hypothetical protein